MADKEAIKAFYEEYAKLCYRHNMYIGACGCCHSPWITSGKEEDDRVLEKEDIAEAMKYIREGEDIDGD